ncbi:MAG TPA: hypothetical protein VFW19_13155 [Allosphingosinicella sp.]|nr:hypothetical protein [Allosphingosinicella sp.]
MRVVPALSALLLLGGCAGYAADYWKPKQSLVAPQLGRYGLSGTQSQCVERRLTKMLGVWQLRQLGDLAAQLRNGGANPGRLGPADFLYVAGLVHDPKVGAETKRAFDACHVAIAAEAPAPETPPPPPAPPPASTPGLVPGAPAAAAGTAPPPARPALWVNLGTASTGQGISVDAASIANGPSWRQAWFRLTNAGPSGGGDIAYLLRIDCAAKSITALGGRKYSQAGELIEQKDYPKPEGPLAVEAGTVMELAFRGVCT